MIETIFILTSIVLILAGILGYLDSQNATYFLDKYKK